MAGPIGVFDSGMGGLTVLREIVSALPSHDTIYLGDTARVPYGVRSAETIRRYARENAEFLLLQGISCFLFLLLACAPLADWSTSLGFFLLPCIFYIWICFKLYDRRSGFSGVVLEGLLESSYIVAGLSALLWLMAVNGRMS